MQPHRTTSRALDYEKPGDSTPWVRDAQSGISMELSESGSDSGTTDDAGHHGRAGSGVPVLLKDQGQQVLALGHPRPLYVVEKLRTDCGAGHTWL